MQRTRYNKTLIKEIKIYILSDLTEEEKKETISELKRYRDEFRNEVDYNWYNYGNIMPYYYQIRTFYNNIGVKPSENDCIMCENFKKHLGKAIDEILEENQ